MEVILVLNNISKELRFEILKNEFTHDYMYQKSMDIAWHYGANIKGYLEGIKCKKIYSKKK